MSSHTSVEHIDSVAPSDARPDHEVEVFFDGDCPLCNREVAWLRRRDKDAQIRFTNIAAPNFSPEALGLTMDQLMAEMHGRLPDGTWIKGVEVFRRLYGVIGHTWIVAVSRWPVVSQCLSLGYRVYARNRLRLTGRCGPDSTSCPKDVSG